MALDANGATRADDGAGFAGEVGSIAFGNKGASGDLRLDFAGLFNPDP